MSGFDQFINHLGNILQTALVYTVLGMGVVFCMLIFISFIISQFVHINRLVMKRREREQERRLAQAASFLPDSSSLKEQDSVIEEVITDDQEELSNDRELAAIIAAAIAAYTDMPADGFVVRSIRRSRGNQW